eukprot:TRINITY_DN1184_c0_g1_i2.p2 TRINITY_DN1184_c0_g1~~TRINITY_DN1184_c0_g1_i2.p2  ORF type:complete len:296 (-),score=65.27 TRINITY_DN1184_c0_g1_i2:156-1043(-)
MYSALVSTQSTWDFIMKQEKEPTENDSLNENYPSENVEDEAPRIDSSDPLSLEFGKTFDEQYQLFAEGLAAQYKVAKQKIVAKIEEDFNEECRQRREEYLERNQLIENCREEAQFADSSAEHRLEVIGRFIDLKQNRLLKRRILDYWKSSFAEEKRRQKLAIYETNRYKRILLKKAFLILRREAHNEKKREIEQEFNFKREQLKSTTLSSYDSRIREMMVKIEAAKQILTEEIDVKERLTLEYESALNRGVGSLSKETQIISANPIVSELSFVQNRSVQEIAPLSQTPPRGSKYV